MGQEASILIGEVTIETPNKIVNSLIGRYVTIRSGSNHLPKGHKLIVGAVSPRILGVERSYAGGWRSPSRIVALDHRRQTYDQPVRSCPE